MQRYVASIENYLVWRDAKARQVLSDVCESLGKVHQVPFLPLLPVEYSAPDTIQGQGVYEFIPASAGVSKPIPFRIRIRQPYSYEVSFAQPEFSFLHEIGHFIDHQGWAGNGFASELSSELATWRDAVTQSAAVQELRRLQTQTEIVVPHKSDLIFSVPQKTLSYLLQERELWARSYAQYVATQSADGTLLRQVQQERERNAIVYLPRQWEDDDFLSVSDAITRLFNERGWK